MYELLGASLALAGLLTVNAIASLIASGVWRMMSRRARLWSAVTRSRLLFALRVFPTVGALFLVFGIIAPSYLIYEPAHTGEEIGPGLAVMAALAVLGVLLAVWRGVAAWLATRKLIREWTRAGQPLSLGSTPLPSYILRHPFPVIAIVGVIRPRIFVAEQVLSALTPEELNASVAHELGHLSSHDNLKRTILRACRDVLTIVPCGRFLDRSWTDASEEAADERATDGDPIAALNLASALIKIARLVPHGASPTMPSAAYLIGGNESGAINERVRKLLQRRAGAIVSNRLQERVVGIALWSIAVAFLSATFCLAVTPGALAYTHSGLEWVVAALK